MQELSPSPTRSANASNGSGYVHMVLTPQAVPVDLSDAPDARAPVQPRWALYANVLVALLQPLQYGWSTTQLNLTTFNNEEECNVRPVAAGTCLMFPGHSQAEWTTAVSAWIVGGMIGSLVCGKLSDKFGRKRVMMTNCLFMIAGAVVQASALDIWMFIAGRVLSGIASGSATAVIPGFIGEISPPRLRNKLGVGFQIAITLGNLLVAITFFFADTSSGWRYIAGFPIVLAVLFLVLAHFVMVESPAWLLMVGRPEEAERELARLFGDGHVRVAKAGAEGGKHSHVESLESVEHNAWDVESPICDVEAETREFEHSTGVIEREFFDYDSGSCDLKSGSFDFKSPSCVTADHCDLSMPLKPQPESSSFGRLFSPLVVRQMLTAIGIAAAQQLTGINAVFFYSSDLFDKAGIADDRIGILAVNSVNVLPTFLCGMLASRLGNRRLILIGLAGMCLSAVGVTVSLVVSAPALAIVFVATFVATFGSSLGSLAWVVMADLFPDDVRAMGSSVCVGCTWLCNLAVGIGYPYMAAALDNYGFVPFMGTTALAFVFVYSMVPDTSGKSVQEIQEEFHAQRTRKL